MPATPRRNRPGKIFISYRREDSQAITGRIDGWLVERMPREDVFIDIDSIEYGTNFAERIKTTISQCLAMLVVIGPHWLNDEEELSQSVRVEVEQALQNGLQIIPLLVEGASLPPAERLPESVRSLVYLNAAPVRSGRDFQRDMQDVAEALHLPIRQHTRSREPLHVGSQISRRAVLTTAAGVAGATALGLAALNWFGSRTSVYPYSPRSVLYIFEEDKASLFALNMRDGSVRWKRQTEAEFTSFTPLTVGTTVYLGASDGTLYALDGNTGTPHWQQSIPGATITSAFVVAGSIFVNSRPSSGSPKVLPTLYAFSADSGSLRWQASNFTAILAQDALYGVISTRRTVNGFNRDDVTGLSALTLDNGVPRWSSPLSSLGEFSVSSVQPILLDQALYLASDISNLDSGETSTLYAFDIRSGSLLWQAHTTGKETLLAGAGESVFLSTQLASPAVLAVNTADGHRRWAFPITPRIPDELGEPSMVTVAGDNVLFSADGVYELDAQTGSIRSHYLSGLGIDASQPLVAEDMVYVTSPGFDESTFALNTYATVYAVSRKTTDRPLIWKKRLDSGRADNLTIVGNTLVFSSGHDGLYAVNRTTGAVLWRFQSGASNFTAPILGPQA